MKKTAFLFMIFTSLVFSADNIIIKNSNYGVSQTIQNIKERAIKKGFGVFTIINHKGNATIVGEELQEAKLIIFSNPKIDAKMMQENILVGLDLPMKVLVYRAGESKVELAYKKASSLKNIYNLKNNKLLSQADKMLDEITNKAIK